jgi:cytochrome bd-type quinol oxidase subunit 2
MVTANGNEEAFDKAKKIILYSVLGLVMIAMSSEIATILDLRDGGILGDQAEIRERFAVFDKSVNIIITFIKYVIGAVAVLMLVISGANMVAKGGNEEEAAKEKKRIGYISLGLVGLIFVDNIIRNVLYKIDKPLSDPTIDVSQGIREIVSFTNLIITFVGPVAILTLVAGGAMYVFSAGNDETQEKAKKMIFTSLVGIILIYGAFGIVSTIVAGRF